MNKSEFTEKLGGVFEHSPWVAEAVFDDLHKQRTEPETLDADELSDRFEQVFMNSQPHLQLQVLRAHPQLACAIAADVPLSENSANEQAGAGLDQCNEAEFAEFERLNTAYLDKFGYPCIIAVRGRDRMKILNLFRMRLQNDAVLEYQTAIRQVCQIARFRIKDILDD